MLRGGYLEPLVLLEPPAHNTGCCIIGLTYSSGTFVSFFVFTAGCRASGPPGPPLHPPWNPWNIQLSQGTGQGVSMTFNAASRLRSLEDRSAALGSRRCELPGMHSVPTSAVLPYASGVGGLSRRLLNIYIYMYLYTYLHRHTYREKGKECLMEGSHEACMELTPSNTDEAG